jgi:uncharacterized protein
MENKMKLSHTDIDMQKITEIAEKYQIRELFLFGSVLRDDFDSNSDIDILVTFKENTHFSYFDLCDLKDELIELFNRKIDLVEKESLINPYRRSEILKTAKRIYAA